MNPLRQSPQRGCTPGGSRPKKGCGGGKLPRPHLLRPRLQGRRLLAAIAVAEDAAGRSPLCPVSSVLSFPCTRRRGAGPALWCRRRRRTPTAAGARAPSEPTHGKLSPLATSRRRDPLPPRVMRPRWAGRNYFLLPPPTAAPRDGRGGGAGAAEPPLLPPAPRGPRLGAQGKEGWGRGLNGD